MKKKTVEKKLGKRIQPAAKKHTRRAKPTEQEIKNTAFAKAKLAVFYYYEYEDDYEQLERLLYLKLNDDSLSDENRELIEENRDFFDNPDILERVKLVAKMLLSLKEMENCEVGRCIRSFNNKKRFNDWLEKLRKRGCKNLPEPFKI